MVTSSAWRKGVHRAVGVASSRRRFAEISGWMLLLLIAGAGCSRWDDSLSRLQEAGVIRIGYAVEAPYAFLATDGRVTGEAPEIALRMARRLGIPKVEWRQCEFDDLIEKLRAGKIDVIAAGMFATPERARRVAFSRPTCQVGEGLVVAKGNPHHLHAYQDLAADGALRVAVLDGSTEEEILRPLGVKAEQCVSVPDALAGVAAVEDGLADALALSAPTVRWLTRPEARRRCEAARPFRQPPAGEHGAMGAPAFAFRLGDRRLREAWDEALAGWLGSREHRELASRFGFAVDEGGGERLAGGGQP